MADDKFTKDSAITKKDEVLKELEEIKEKLVHFKTNKEHIKNFKKYYPNDYNNDKKGYNSDTQSIVFDNTPYDNFDEIDKIYGALNSTNWKDQYRTDYNGIGKNIQNLKSRPEIKDDQKKKQAKEEAAAKLAKDNAEKAAAQEKAVQDAETKAKKADDAKTLAETKAKKADDAKTLAETKLAEAQTKVIRLQKELKEAEAKIPKSGAFTEPPTPTTKEKRGDFANYNSGIRIITEASKPRQEFPESVFGYLYSTDEGVARNPLEQTVKSSTTVGGSRKKKGSKRKTPKRRRKQKTLVKIQKGGAIKNADDFKALIDQANGLINEYENFRYNLDDDTDLGKMIGKFEDIINDLKDFIIEEDNVDTNIPAPIPEPIASAVNTVIPQNSVSDNNSNNSSQSTVLKKQLEVFDPLDNLI
jgi:hypothetical protein